MKLPKIFATSSNRIILTPNPCQAFLNGSTVTSHDEEEIKLWCKANTCIFHEMGIISFPNDATMTLFLLRWS